MTPREELEVRLTALLLGELSADEAATLRDAITKDPELARLHGSLQRTIGLVREAGTVKEQEVGAGAVTETAAEAPKLSAERREKLLATFRTIRPAALTPAALPARRPIPREWLAVAAMVVGLTAVAAFIVVQLGEDGGGWEFAAIESGRSMSAGERVLTEGLAAESAPSPANSRSHWKENSQKVETFADDFVALTDPQGLADHPAPINSPAKLAKLAAPATAPAPATATSQDSLEVLSAMNTDANRTLKQLADLPTPNLLTAETPALGLPLSRVAPQTPPSVEPAVTAENKAKAQRPAIALPTIEDEVASVVDSERTVKLALDGASGPDGRFKSSEAAGLDLFGRSSGGVGGVVVAPSQQPLVRNPEPVSGGRGFVSELKPGAAGANWGFAGVSGAGSVAAPGTVPPAGPSRGYSFFNGANEDLAKAPMPSQSPGSSAASAGTKDGLELRDADTDLKAVMVTNAAFGNTVANFETSLGDESRLGGFRFLTRRGDANAPLADGRVQNQSQFGANALDALSVSSASTLGRDNRGTTENFFRQSDLFADGNGLAAEGKKDKKLAEIRSKDSGAIVPTSPIAGDTVLAFDVQAGKPVTTTSASKEEAQTKRELAEPAATEALAKNRVENTLAEKDQLAAWKSLGVGAVSKPVSDKNDDPKKLAAKQNELGATALAESERQKEMEERYRAASNRDELARRQQGLEVEQAWAPPIRSAAPAPTPEASAKSRVEIALPQVERGEAVESFRYRVASGPVANREATDLSLAVGESARRSVEDKSGVGAAPGEANLSQVLERYGELTGQTVLRPSSLPELKVNLENARSLTRDSEIKALDEILSAHGVTMIPQPGTKFVKAVGIVQAGAAGSALGEAVQEFQSVVLKVPPGTAANASRMLTDWATKNQKRAKFIPDERVNAMLVFASEEDLATISRLVQDLDAPRKLAPTAAVPQPEVFSADNAFSTFSLNVSDVSFKLAAASLEKGQMPDPATVRSEEFINAFDYRDPEPKGSAPVAFAWERARYPFAHDRDLVRLSVKTAAAGRQPGRPLNLVLLLDNSGSMERADRLRIRQECLRVLAGQLRPEDRVSVVAFARTARLWVDGLTGAQAGELPQRVGTLTPEGGTNLEDAMKVAYQTALRHFVPNGVNRVVLLTDGAANLGDVEPESLKKLAESNRKQGIALDCFGIGWEGYNDDLLETLSRNADGRYGFINTPEAAASEFAGQLAGALQVAAADVKVQVEWNPRRVTAYRQIGYAKHQLKKEQFRDNTVDAAEIGAAEAGNALYVVQVNPRGEGPLGTMRVRFKVPGTGDYREQEWPLAYDGAAKSLDQTSGALRLAASASAFSEWLVSSPFAAEVTPDQLLNFLSGVPEQSPADPRPKKLEWMIRQAKSLSGK